MRNITNFQTDLLRTFVSVIDLGAYTKAGDVLGRTQPAISLQMRRLFHRLQISETVFFASASSQQRDAIRVGTKWARPQQQILRQVLA